MLAGEKGNLTGPKVSSKKGGSSVLIGGRRDENKQKRGKRRGYEDTQDHEKERKKGETDTITRKKR